MSDLPSPLQAGSPDVRLAGTELERDRGLPLTPAETAARKRNRRWLLLIAIPSVAVLALALITSGVADSNSPSAPTASAPVGYQSVNDGYFSYVVPTTWPSNPDFTDSAGDVDHSGPSGWAGEHIGYRTSAPVIGEAQPSSLAVFGMARPQPYRLSDGHRIVVTGAPSSYQYEMTRPGGFRATVVNTWNSRYGVELWLVVDATPAITAEVIDHLEA